MSTQKYLSLSTNAEYHLYDAIDSSSGIADANKIICTNSQGIINSSLIKFLNFFEIFKNSFKASFEIATLTENRNYILPNKNGKIAILNDNEKTSETTYSSNFIDSKETKVLFDGRFNGNQALIKRSFNNTVNISDIRHDPLNKWNNITKTWVVPETAKYLIISRVRLGDIQEFINWGQGVDINNVDGDNFLWSRSFQRHMILNITCSQYTLNDELRLFLYPDFDFDIDLNRCQLIIIKTN